jgi:hypothetical protein
MTKDQIVKSRLARRTHEAALVFTALALGVSLAVAAAAVSIGIARADGLNTLVAFAGGSIGPRR